MQKLQYGNLIQGLECYKSLHSSIALGNLPHAIMLVGSDKLALEIFAKSVAALYLSGGDESEKQLVYSMRHTDCFFYPNPHDEKVKESLNVADANEIAKGVYITPLRGSKKVYVINGVQNMNLQGQNKLLKTLEEPPKNVHFILTCTNQYAVLPTVVSRCKKIDVPLFCSDELFSSLSEKYIDKEAVEFAVSGCGGSLTMAAEFLSDKRKVLMFNDCFSVLANLKSSKDVLEQVALLGKYSDNLSQVIDYFEIIMRDVALLVLGQEKFISLKNHQQLLKQIAQNYSFSACERIMKVLSKSKMRLKTNANINSTLDEMIFSFAEIKAKYK